MRIIRRDDLGVSNNLLSEAQLRLPNEGEAYGFIVDLLVRNMYSNPISACVRELVSNAIDANVDADKQSIPIEVTLNVSNTLLNEDLYELSIRDYGKGITPEQMDRIVEFGYSSKRDGNDADRYIGAYGVGIKSLFNVTEQAIIKSYVEGGTGYEYIAYKNNKGIRAISLLKEFSFNEEPLGTDIRLMVDKEMSLILSKEVSINCCWFNPSIKTNIGSLLSNSKYIKTKRLKQVCLGKDISVLYNTIKDTKSLSIVKSLHGNDSLISYGGLSLVIGGVPYYGVWDITTLNTRAKEYIQEKSEDNMTPKFSTLELIFEVPINIGIHINSNRESIQMTNESKDTIERLFVLAMDYLWEQETSIGKGINDIWNGIEVIRDWVVQLGNGRLLKGNIYLEDLGIYIGADSMYGELPYLYNQSLIPIQFNIKSEYKYTYFSGDISSLSPEYIKMLGLPSESLYIEAERLKCWSLPTILLRDIPLVLTNSKSHKKIRKKLGWSEDKPFLLRWIKDREVLEKCSESKAYSLLGIHTIIFTPKSSEVFDNVSNIHRDNNLNTKKISSLLKSGFLKCWDDKGDFTQLSICELESLPLDKVVYIKCNRQKNELEYWHTDTSSNSLYACSLLLPNNVYVITPNVEEKLKILGIELIYLNDYLYEVFINPLIGEDIDLFSWLVKGLSASYWSNTPVDSVYQNWSSAMINVFSVVELLNTLLPGSIKSNVYKFIRKFYTGLGYKELIHIEPQLILSCIYLGSFQLVNTNQSESYLRIRNKLKESISINNYRTDKSPFLICLNPEHKLYELLCNLDMRNMSSDTLSRIINVIQH